MSSPLPGTGGAQRSFVLLSTVLAALALVIALAVPGLAASALRGAYVGEAALSGRVEGGDAPRLAQDALWLGHAWVDGRRGEVDVEALRRRLDGTGIRDLYVHTGPLGYDGRLDPARHPRLPWAVAALRAAVPGVRVHAWLGQKVGPGKLDLAEPMTREAVLAGFTAVLATGVDGIHVNIEPVLDGDPDFLRVMADARALTRDAGRLLSVSAQQVEPFPGAIDVVSALRPDEGKYWSPDYLAAVADSVDQVALMTYDTLVPAEDAYGGYVVRQVRAALRAVPPEVHLLVGVPAYHDRGWHRVEEAETVAAAVRAARIARPGPDRPYGVALYVDFAATEEDWTAYRTGWLS